MQCVSWRAVVKERQPGLNLITSLPQALGLTA